MENMQTMARMAEHTTRIWTPGQFDSEGEAAKAVADYDQNLFLGRHTLTGDWVIWLKNGGSNPRPVIGIGPHLPDRETLVDRLRAADTRIHGDSILKQMHEHNDALEKKNARMAEEATGMMAEALDWARIDIKGYSGRTANVKGRKRDFKPKET